MDDPTTHPHVWHDFIVNNHKLFRRIVDACDRDPTLVRDMVSQTAEPPAGERHVCPICSCERASYAILCGHLSKTHRHKSTARAYTHSTHCLSCLTEFFHRPRLLRHLAKRGSRCLARLQMHADPLPQQSVEQLDAEDLIVIRKLKSQGLPKYHHKLPPVRLCGPLQYWPLPDIDI